MPAAPAGACSTDPAANTSTETPSYTYALDVICGERDLIGSFEIAAKDHVCVIVASAIVE
jgi:hypothetical protein